MPIYVYKNLRTGDTFEVSQRITESALTEHPETGDPVKRIVQPVGIAFKGSGFYVTDNRPGSKTGAASKSGAASKGAAASKDGAAPKDGAGTSTGASTGASTD
ncbi:MAG TPA: FmdB family zinc ribbon protein [Trueperaceae bacterium]|nr:FmdB family zinc ribbon protein [Trueperaceae bacterium]